jgi:hypothetical protein
MTPVRGPAVRKALRDWIIKTNGTIDPAELNDSTPIIERRILKSVHVLDLILLIERLNETPIDPGKLKVGVFRSIDAIVDNFFPEDGDGC